MYTQYKNALEAMHQGGFAPAQTFGYYNNQYNRTEELKAVKYPAVYVEFPGSFFWTQDLNKVRNADIEIFFHIVLFDIGDAIDQILALGAQHVTFLQGKDMRTPGGVQISTAFAMTTTELLLEYDQVKVFKVGYSANVIDCTGVDEQTETGPITFIVQPPA